MKFSYSREFNTAYFPITENRDIKNSEEVRAGIILDLDPNKKILGLELIGPSGCFCTESIKDAFSKLLEEGAEQVTFVHDREGATLTVWFQEPTSEFICEETTDEVIQIKNVNHEVIGMEILNFHVSSKTHF